MNATFGAVWSVNYGCHKQLFNFKPSNPILDFELNISRKLISRTQGIFVGFKTKRSKWISLVCILWKSKDREIDSLFNIGTVKPRL